MPAISSTRRCKDFGFARGDYRASADDGLELVDCRITNAVRCVPPENKPTPQEITTCRDFLAATVKEMPQLTAVLALGRIAHETFVVLKRRAALGISFRPWARACARWADPVR